MNSSEIMDALAQPFETSEVEWRLQYSNENSGFAVPYIDSRAIQNRLDEVLGSFNWYNSFVEWHNNAQLCGISIYCEDRREWITKYDGADNSDIEPIKGGLSDSFKRAAVQWGIGRFLYEMDGVWVDIEKKGKTTVIKKEQQSKLDAAYNSAVARIFSGQPAVSNVKPKTPKQEKPEPPLSPPRGVMDAAPNRPPIGSGDNVTQMFPVYTVTSAKANGNGSAASTTLEMTDAHGKKLIAYLRGENPEITAGIKLKDLKLTEKESGYGPYFILDSFEFAA